MYEYIDGKMALKGPTYVVLEANGVAYRIHISLNTYAQLGDGERCKIYTWLHVKEDAHTLYGFADEGERKLFLHLISVSGIGTATAVIMLSSMSPAEIQQAIVSADVVAIQRIKGIGAKTAQRTVLELQDKLKKEGFESLISLPKHNTIKDEALSALIMLGFGKQVVDKVLEKIAKDGQSLTVEQMIKLALKNL